MLGNKAAFGTSAVAINGVSISASANLSSANAIANTVALGGNNTFTGTNNIEFSGPVTLTSTRTITNNLSAGTLKTSGTLGLSASASNNTLTVNGSGNTAISGVIANNGTGGTATSGNLTYSGSGILTLSGASANTYTGLTTVSSGELDLNKTAGVNAIAGDGNTGTDDVLINGGTLQWGASNQLANDASIAMSSGAFSLNGFTETLWNFSNSGGTFTTGAGTLHGAGSSIAWAGGTNIVNNGGTVEDKHFIITGGTNTVNGGATGGVLQISSGGTGLEMTGSTLTLDSSNSVAGKLLLQSDVSVHGSSATSTIASGAALTNAGNVNLDGGTRTFTVDSTNTLVVDAVITNGSLTKAGAGLMDLSGANTYTGATAVNAGTLLVNGNQSTANGSVSVNNSGTTLGGTGNIGGAVTVNQNANITAATDGTVGSLTLASLTFTGASGNLATFIVDLVGATSDTLNITGLLDLSGMFDALVIQRRRRWYYAPIFWRHSARSTAPSIRACNRRLPVHYGATSLELSPLTPVPEPSTWVAGALALLAVGYTQRRRFARKSAFASIG